MFERLRGQFAIALWDERERHQLTLGRDRFGICPLYWTRQGDWLLFASEIKALLASGMVPARPDRRGIDHIFTFAAMPGPITCFEGVQIAARRALSGNHARQRRRRGTGDHGARLLGNGFPGSRVTKNAATTRASWWMNSSRSCCEAVDTRLRADVPVGSYLSGGVDSSMIVALACHLKGPAINTYTIRVDEPELDELDAANLVAPGTSTPSRRSCRSFAMQRRAETCIRNSSSAAEAPVIDTSCAALAAVGRGASTSAGRKSCSPAKARTNGWSAIRGTRSRRLSTVSTSCRACT